jgi:hypothetical protein
MAGLFGSCIAIDVEGFTLIDYLESYMGNAILRPSSQRATTGVGA